MNTKLPAVQVETLREKQQFDEQFFPQQERQPFSQKSQKAWMRTTDRIVPSKEEQLNPAPTREMTDIAFHQRVNSLTEELSRKTISTEKSKQYETPVEKIMPGVGTGSKQPMSTNQYYKFVLNDQPPILNPTAPRGGIAQGGASSVAPLALPTSRTSIDQITMGTKGQHASASGTRYEKQFEVADDKSETWDMARVQEGSSAVSSTLRTSSQTAQTSFEAHRETDFGKERTFGTVTRELGGESSGLFRSVPTTAPANTEVANVYASHLLPSFVLNRSDGEVPITELYTPTSNVLDERMLNQMEARRQVGVSGTLYGGSAPPVGQQIAGKTTLGDVSQGVSQTSLGLSVRGGNAKEMSRSDVSVPRDKSLAAHTASVGASKTGGYLGSSSAAQMQVTGKRASLSVDNPMGLNKIQPVTRQVDLGYAADMHLTEGDVTDLQHVRLGIANARADTAMDVSRAVLSTQNMQLQHLDTMQNLKKDAINDAINSVHGTSNGIVPRQSTLSGPKPLGEVFGASLTTRAPGDSLFDNGSMSRQVNTRAVGNSRRSAGQIMTVEDTTKTREMGNKLRRLMVKNKK
jgi:hypothetical protein